MRYVVSDIHGCLEEFEELLEKIKFSGSDHLYVLGDAMDRGKEPISVLQKLMKMDNVTYIIGNHDMYLYHLVTRFGIDLCNVKDEDDKKVIQFWLDDGGISTMIQFITLPQEEREKICEFIEDASVYEEIEHNGERYVLVHAGIFGFDEERALDTYEADDFIYERADYKVRYFENENTWLVTGHTPTPFIREDNRPLVYKKNGHIAIDCGCVYGGQLAAYCIETGESTYVVKT